MPDHRTLTADQCHEAKQILSASTVDAGKVITPSPVFAGTGELRKLHDSELDYTDKTKNTYGWNTFQDALYTSSNKRAIAGNTRTQITNDKLGAQTDQSRLGSFLWQAGAQNKFVFDNEANAVFMIRLDMKVSAAAAAGTPYVVKLDWEAGDTPTSVGVDTKFIKGGGYENVLTFTFPLYIGPLISTSLGEDVKLFITADTAINLWDAGIFIQRIYKES